MRNLPHKVLALGVSTVRAAEAEQTRAATRTSWEANMVMGKQRGKRAWAVKRKERKYATAASAELLCMFGCAFRFKPRPNRDVVLEGAIL